MPVLFSAVTTPQTSVAQNLFIDSGGPYYDAYVMASVSGTGAVSALVDFELSIDQGATWFDVVSMSLSGNPTASKVALYPPGYAPGTGQIRAKLVSIGGTGASVNAQFFYQAHAQ